jgi:hypothetical protein
MVEMLDEVQRVFVLDNKQLIEIVDRRQADLDLRQAQIEFVNCAARREDKANREPSLMERFNEAELRLIALFMDGWGPRPLMTKAWSAYRRHLLYHTRAQS